MKIVPLTLEHIRQMEPQDAQKGQTLAERLETARVLIEQGSAYAAVNEDGVMCVAGITPQWDGRAVAWALLSRDAGPHMVKITRTVRRFLDTIGYRRIEMYVDAQFCNGCRWAEMLGFKNETPDGMAGFLPNGNRAFMYGRTQ